MVIFWIVFAVLIYLVIGYCIDMDLCDGYDTPHLSFILLWLFTPIIYAGIVVLIVVSDIIDQVTEKFKSGRTKSDDKE